MEGHVYVEVEGKGTETEPAEQGAEAKQRAKAEPALQEARAEQKTTTAEKMGPKIPTVEQTTARVELKTTTAEQI